MGKVMKHVGAEMDDVRQVFVFPPPREGRGEFTLIEDDGVTMGYRHDEYARVNLEVETQQDVIALNIRVSGNYRLPYNTVEFILPRGETRRLDTRGDEWLEANQRHFRLEIKE